MGETPSVRDEVKDDEGGNKAGLGIAVLNYIGFKWDVLSATEVSGYFVVNPKSSQPFGLLHGGITGYVAETLASCGAGVAARGNIVFGMDLSVTHLQSAPIGTEVRAKAIPLRLGKKVQVWNVNFTTSKTKDSSPNEAQDFTTIAVARLSLIVGPPIPPNMSTVIQRLIDLPSTRKMESVPPVSKL